LGLETPGLYWFRHRGGGPYVKFGKMFYMPTRACSRGYKLRSREGECPKSLDVVVSYECSIGECSVLLVLYVVFCVLDPTIYGVSLPFIVQGGLVYKG
jgi:hypothetical protein